MSAETTLESDPSRTTREGPYQLLEKKPGHECILLEKLEAASKVGIAKEFLLGIDDGHALAALREILCRLQKTLEERGELDEGLWNLLPSLIHRQIATLDRSIERLPADIAMELRNLPNHLRNEQEYRKQVSGAYLGLALTRAALLERKLELYELLHEIDERAEPKLLRLVSRLF